jgi:hypothetical protein
LHLKLVVHWVLQTTEDQVIPSVKFWKIFN